MKNNLPRALPSFLFQENGKICQDALVTLNLILNGLAIEKKPYQINYHTLLMSYSLWRGSDLDEFCHKQALSYFLFNPQNDSEVAREALFIEIREFLAGFSKV